MKKLLYTLLLCLPLGLSAQNNNQGQTNQPNQAVAKSYFQSYSMTFNKTDQLAEPVEAGKLKEGEYYFVVQKKGDQLQSIGYYDHQGNLQSYLLDRYYNLYFQYITYEYEKSLLKTKFFKDKTDFVLARVDYEYDANKKISKTTLQIYSLPKRKLVKLEETMYTYQGDAYKMVERKNTIEQTYEKIVYNGSKAAQEYERYDIDGKTLQYRIKYYYANNQLAKREYYSKANVLIRTVIEEKVATAANPQNNNNQQ